MVPIFELSFCVCFTRFGVHSDEYLVNELIRQMRVIVIQVRFKSYQ